MFLSYISRDSVKLHTTQRHILAFQFPDCAILVDANNAYSVEGFAVAGSRGWFYDDTAEADKKVILREAGRLRMSLQEASKLGGELIAFLHYPPISANQECEEILSVYRYAVENRYRFFSFGDACLFL